MSPHDQAKSHHSFNILDNVSFGEGIDLAVGLTATALTADQLVKLAHTKKHTTQHLVKGGLSAGLATAAFAMLAREHREKHDEQELQRRRRRSLVESRQRALSIQSDDDERVGRTMALAPRPRRSRSTSSTHSTYSEHFRKQDPAQQQRSWGPARRRALSHSPTRRDRTFAESHPNLVKFAEAVRDNLRDSDHR